MKRVIRHNQNSQKPNSNFSRSKPRLAVPCPSRNQTEVVPCFSKANHSGSRNCSKLPHSHLAYAIISSAMVGSAAFLFGLTYGLICPMVQPDSTSAESSTSASSTITASSDSIISISAPDSVALSVTPNFESSVFTTASATVTVSTNNAYGYTLSMGTSGTDSSGNASTSLIHSGGSYTIPTLSADTTASTFSSTTDTTTNNMWGYTLDNTTYNPLTTSTSPTVIKTTKTTASADTTTVTFGTKITSSQPSGNYSNIVVFSATANPKPTTIFDISTMQEMTATICNNTTTPDAVTGDDVKYDTNESHYGDSAYVPKTTLIDTRDNNEYTVVKLADGNCWMQENLALGTDSEDGITLTSEDSDVSSDWTLPAYTSIGTTWSSGTNDAYVIQGSTSASSNWTTGMGNWYTWGAATTGTASSATTKGTDATDSICPKGWQLPVTDTSYSYNAFGSTLDKSFGGLFTAYDLTSSSGTTYTVIRSVPLLFTYSGSYDYSDGSVYKVGSDAHYWSSTAASSTNAYSLHFYISNVNPQCDHYQGYGYSVRCVAQ